MISQQGVTVNKLFDLPNQVWRYKVTSSLICQIKQHVNLNSQLHQSDYSYNLALIFTLDKVYCITVFAQWVMSIYFAFSPQTKKHKHLGQTSYNSSLSTRLDQCNT